MGTERTAKEWILLAALVVLWGSAFLLIKLALTSIPPLTAVGMRLILGFAVLGTAMTAMRLRLPPLLVVSPNGGRMIGPHWPYLVAVGIAGNALPFALVMWGQTEIDSGLAGIFMAFAPLTTLAVAHLALANERLTPTKTAGFLLGFAGVSVLMGPMALNGAGSAAGHQLAVLAGAVIYGISNVFARRMPPLHPVAASTAVILCAGLVIVPFAVIVDRPWSIEPSALSLVTLLLLGLFPTGLATVVFFALINSAGAGFASLSSYFIPLWAVFLGAVFLSERLDWTVLAALALILGGVALSQTRGRRTSQQSWRSGNGRSLP